MTSHFEVSVAAPSSHVDALAPWADPMTSSDKALAAGFWASFHGLSAFAHGVAVFIALFGTLLPIPFFAAMCSDVKPVEQLNERVEMTVVEAPKKPEPPPPPPTLLAAGADGVALRSCVDDADCAAGERCVDHICVAKAKDDKKKTRKKKRHEPEMAMLIARMEPSDFGVLGALTSDSLVGGVEGGVVGGLIGNSIGDSSGFGGLGVSGVGQLVSAEPLPTLTMDVDDDNHRRAVHSLASCPIGAAVEGVAHVDGGVVRSVSTTPKSPCVERRLKSALRGLADGDVPFALVPDR